MTKNRRLTDAFYLLAHLTFYPLAYLTFFPEVRLDLFGIGQNFTIDGGMWATLIACCCAIISAKGDYDLGPMGRAGSAFLMIIFCLLTPFLFGFVALTLMLIATGGLVEMLPYLWKAALFFGFLWFYMTAG
jgi:hypothetical protein